MCVNYRRNFDLRVHVRKRNSDHGEDRLLELPVGNRLETDAEYLRDSAYDCGQYLCNHRGNRHRRTDRIALRYLYGKILHAEAAQGDETGRRSSGGHSLHRIRFLRPGGHRADDAESFSGNKRKRDSDGVHHAGDYDFADNYQRVGGVYPRRPGTLLRGGAGSWGNP